MDGKGESQWKKDGKVRRQEMAKKGDFAGSWFLQYLSHCLHLEKVSRVYDHVKP